MFQEQNYVKEEWNREKEDYISQLQAQIQQLEQENTDFLAALEDAMEQYKQQVREHWFSYVRLYYTFKKCKLSSYVNAVY